MNGPKDYHTKRKITHDITYLWNLKYNINEHIYETKGESGSPALQVDSLPTELSGKHTHRYKNKDLWLPRVKQRDRLGLWY